jgi:hypothetical protein
MTSFKKRPKPEVDYRALKRGNRMAYESLFNETLERCDTRKWFKSFGDIVPRTSLMGITCEPSCICFTKCMADFGIPKCCPRRDGPKGPEEIAECVACTLFNGRCRFK